uniref:Uncharacterized protein n=1 Tax=Trichogramma kaykai TaxID=54128 RepID=A0ABD2XKC0_9HYME
MFTSDDESDLSFFVPSDDCDSKDMHQVDKDNLKKFKGIRDKFNQKIEEERHELLDQLESLIRNWKGQLTDLRPFLQREEIDRLLIKFMKDSYSIFSSIYIIELVIRTGYKDEPELDKDGVPLSRRTTPLHQAARRRCFYVVDRLFKIYNRYDVNYTDESGLTHFHVACRYGCNGVVRKFLELGQTPNCLARESVDPPLHLAMRNFDKETMELLLRSGADANLINKDGLTPLHIICKSVERYDDKLAKLFFEVNEKVDQTVQVHARDKLGRTPLQWAVANLMSDAVDTLLDHVDDLSDFVFPKDLAMKYTLDCTLQMVVFPTMSIVKSLSRKGYSLNQNDALMIMKIFGNYGLIDDSVEVVECLRNDKKFARMAKKQLVTSSMSLYDFLLLPTVKAEKIFTLEDYKEFTSGISHLRDESHRAFIKYLCETVTRGFLRDWALKLFSKKSPWLSGRCCEEIIDQLNVKGLWYICMEASNQSTQWVDCVRTDYIKGNYNRDLSLQFHRGGCFTLNKKI